MTQTTTDIRTPPSNRRWRIFLPTLAFVALAALYSVYWFVLSREITREIEAFAERGDNGLAVGWLDFSMGGYPYRLEARFDQPRAAAPDTPEAWSWRGETAEVALLPYNLRHVILNLRGAHELRYRDLTTATRTENTLTATADGAWASYVDLPDAPFGRVAVDIEGLDMQHRRGMLVIEETVAAERLQLHMRPAPDDAAAGQYDVALQGDKIVMTRPESIPALGMAAEKIVLQARLRNAPLAGRISAVEFMDRWRANGGSLAISDLIVKWGPLDMTARGEVTLDKANRPEGRFDAEIADFEELLEAMTRDGLVKEREARLALAGLTFVSQLQGSEAGRVRVPVIMDGGTLFLGPLAVARLEPLY